LNEPKSLNHFSYWHLRTRVNPKPKSIEVRYANFTLPHPFNQMFANGPWKMAPSLDFWH